MAYAAARPGPKVPRGDPGSNPITGYQTGGVSGPTEIARGFGCAAAVMARAAR